MSVLLQATTVLGLDAGPGWVAFEDGRVTGMGLGWAPREPDAEGDYLGPGLTDLQINGAGGVMFSTVQRVEEVHQALAAIGRCGTAACLPTVFTHPIEQMEQALRVLDETMAAPLPSECSQPLGIHLEGPFLNPEKAGCHPKERLLLPDIALLKRWFGLSGGRIRLLTLAPELPGADKAAAWCRRHGILLSMGHTLFSSTPGQHPSTGGLQLATHLFNAMPPLTAREPGAVMAVLDDQNLTASLIADGVHVAPEMMALAWKYKGPDRLALVSDAMPTLGTASDHFFLLGERIAVTGGVCRTADGVLAGSAFPLSLGVQNLIRHGICTLSEAAACASITPLRLLGGSPRLESGQQTSLIFLNAKGELLGYSLGSAFIFPETTPSPR